MNMKVNEEFLVMLLDGLTAKESLPQSAAPVSSDQSLFARLYEEECYNNLQRSFDGYCTAAGVMSENQFLTFMRSLTDFRDHEIIEIFDIFDYDSVGGISFDEYFLIVSMMAAINCAVCTQFLFLHGKQMFEMLLDPTTQKQKLTHERFTRLGFVMGFSEIQITTSLKDLDFDVFKFISFNDFMMYYFVILDDFDAGRSGDDADKGASSSQALNPPGRQQKRNQKDESCLLM
mmetsp:Transcript_33840/g.46311  ORF Transcript_33840/g.46311 Transcript_33840/m.46311 type:complete len:232 (+) Transcript_33840:2-697(+)